MHNNLMERLARRSHLSKVFGFRYVDGCWPYLEIDHPVGVARLIGEVRQDAGSGRVFLRGQVRHHNAMLPSLFRGNDARDTLRAAERDLVWRIRQTIPVGRFKRRKLPALLQHYKFRTSWLDAVDNLFVAVWFATHALRLATDSLLQDLLGMRFVRRPDGAGPHDQKGPSTSLLLHRSGNAIRSKIEDGDGCERLGGHAGINGGELRLVGDAADLAGLIVQVQRAEKHTAL